MLTSPGLANEGGLASLIRSSTIAPSPLSMDTSRRVVFYEYVTRTISIWDSNLLNFSAQIWNIIENKKEATTLYRTRIPLFPSDESIFQLFFFHLIRVDSSGVPW
jgi:hypothetical protein